jgi:hypothetical protein
MLQPLISVDEADSVLRALASEIACDSFDLPAILSAHQLTLEQFQRIEKTPRFQMLLREALTNWHSTGNTQERTKSKAALSVEDLLPTMHATVVDKSQPLAARVELFKALMKAGGVGEKSGTGAGDSGERFSVTINLGGDNSLKIEQTLPSKVIEGEAL